MKKQLLSAVLAAALCVATVSCGSNEGSTDNSGGGGTDSAKEVNLRMTWWGGNDRNAMMNEVLDLYEEQNPNVTVSREYTNWNDYWTKLATQSSTNSAPDVAWFTMMMMAEYVEKDVVLPLDDLVDQGKIDLSGFSQAAIDAGTYDGQLYSILYGMTVNSIFYNQTMLDEVGMEAPPEKWNMDEFKDYCLKLREKLPEDIYVLETDGGYEHMIETYARSLGKTLYNAEGTGFGFDKQDLVNYWTFWNELRAAGVTPPPQNVAEAFGLSYEESYLATGKCAMMFQNGNFLPTYNNVSDYNIGITTTPTSETGNSGDFLQPTSFSIMKNSKLVDEAAALISWVANDKEALLLFKGDLGMPGNEEGATAVGEEANEFTQRFYEFMNSSILPVVGPVQYRTEGSGDVLTAFKLKYEQVSSGELDIPTAVDEIFAEAEKILAK